MSIRKTIVEFPAYKVLEPSMHYETDAKIITDAVELFIASTMQDFGATQMLESFRATYPGAVTAVKTILANVKAAMAATAQAGKSAATTL